MCNLYQSKNLTKKEFMDLEIPYLHQNFEYRQYVPFWKEEVLRSLKMDKEAVYGLVNEFPLL